MSRLFQSWIKGHTTQSGCGRICVGDEKEFHRWDIREEVGGKKKFPPKKKEAGELAFSAFNLSIHSAGLWLFRPLPLASS